MACDCNIKMLRLHKLSTPAGCSIWHRSYSTGLHRCLVELCNQVAAAEYLVPTESGNARACLAFHQITCCLLEGGQHLALALGASQHAPRLARASVQLALDSGTALLSWLAGCFTGQPAAALLSEPEAVQWALSAVGAQSCVLVPTLALVLPGFLSALPTSPGQFAAWALAATRLLTLLDAEHGRTGGSGCAAGRVLCSAVFVSRRDARLDACLFVPAPAP